MPSPNLNEKKEEFLNRCMESAEANKTFPDNKQRYAFCNSQWEHRNKKDENLIIDIIDSTFKKDDLKNISHVDFLEPDNFMSDKFEETPEGYLCGRAIVTNIGVFPYITEDGIRYELRLPEEVFKDESLNTIKNKPITNNHPTELVNVDNITKYNCGMTGEDINIDGYHVSIPLTITDSTAIFDVKKEKRGLSCGYTCDLEMKSGTYLGVHYDAIQRNIKYNHVAIVSRGRAGDAARIKMDESIKNGVAILDKSKNKNFTKRTDNGMSELTANLKSVKLDGVDYQAEAEVIKTLNIKIDAIDKLNTEISTLKSDSEKITAERDNLKDRVDALTKELDAAKNHTDEAKINELAQKKADSMLELIQYAEKAHVEYKKDLSISEMQKSIIFAVFPETDKSKFDNATDGYIAARFDGVKEILDARSGTHTRELNNFNYNEDDLFEEQEHMDADAARERMIKDLKERSAK